MDDKIKSAYQKVMTCKYAYHLVYEKASNLAYAVNLLGVKRMLMEMSKEAYCDYLCLRDKAISIHSTEIVPDIKYAESLLMKIEEVGTSTLEINSQIFIDRLKKLMKMTRDYLNTEIKLVMEAIEPIQHSYPVDYMKIMKMLKCNYFWLKKLNKREMGLDKMEWDPAWVMAEEKRIHDKIKKNKY